MTHGGRRRMPIIPKLPRLRPLVLSRHDFTRLWVDSFVCGEMYWIPGGARVQSIIDETDTASTVTDHSLPITHIRFRRVTPFSLQFPFLSLLGPFRSLHLVWTCTANRVS